MASSQMYQNFGTGEEQASNYDSPSRGGRQVRFQPINQSEALATVMEGSSDASSPTGSPSSGESLSQLGRNDQAAQQGPTTPQHARSMTASGGYTYSPLTSPTYARTQAGQRYDGSPEKLTPHSRVRRFQGSDRQRRDPRASQVSENWRSSHRPSFNTAPTVARSVDASKVTSMSGIPEYLAVQEMAFRQGQHDRGGCRDQIPASPFARHFDHVWAEYYKLGGVYGGEPAIRPTAHPAASHDNFAWAVLINPATQDLEHPNGTLDMNWTYKMCVMALDGMKELIRVVCGHPNDWRKYVCDIPTPAQHAIIAFPDLCEYYEVLKRDAHEVLSGGMPMGY